MKTQKNKTIPLRVPFKVHKEYNQALDERFRKKLMSRKDWKSAEGFKLISRMPEWKQILFKLKTLPKKEDIK